jgi:hypothetical protein
MTRAFVLVLFVTASSAAAQSADPDGTAAREPGEIVALDEGARAPFAGLLIEEQDLVGWRLRIEQLEHRLTLDVTTETRRCDVRLDLERERTRAVGDVATLRERLWRDRVGQLAGELRDAREDARPSWIESPLLWYVAGVASAVLVVWGVAGL